MLIDFGTAREYKEEHVRIQSALERLDMRRRNSLGEMGRQMQEQTFFVWEGPCIIF